MKSTLLSTITLSMFVLVSCNGGSKTENATNQDSLQQVTKPQIEVSEATIESSCPQTSENIAKIIWDKYFKDKFKNDINNENVTIRFNKSIGNVIYSYQTTTFNEGDEGEMFNNFYDFYLSCYKKSDNSWLIIQVANDWSSNEGYYYYDIKYYNYQNDNLTEFNDNLFAQVTDKLETLDYGCGFNNLFFEFYQNTIIVIDDKKVTAMSWNGDAFNIAPATEKQYISEKDLFYKVANENKYLKGKTFDFTFNNDYLELNQFDADNYQISYGRFKDYNGGYYIYVRAYKEDTKEQTIEKYQFNNGKLSLISDKAFFDEVGLSIKDGIVMFTISNMMPIALFYPYKDDDYDYENVKEFQWNGEKFE